MLAYIKGLVDEITEESVVIETNAGIGFEIRTTGSVLSKMPPRGTEVKMYTYLQVLENDRNIFGFTDKQDLEFFKMLITVNGIGPKGALSILSVLSAEELYRAIMESDSKLLATANGIGKKTAERIVLELKDKVNKKGFVVDFAIDNKKQTVSNDSMQEVSEALVSLGYSNQEAIRAIRKVSNADSLSAEELLKAALKNIF